VLGGEAAARADAALGRRGPAGHDHSALRAEWTALMNAPSDAAAGAWSAIA
jgi:hypothetical protein